MNRPALGNTKTGSLSLLLVLVSLAALGSLTVHASPTVQDSTTTSLTTFITTVTSSSTTLTTLLSTTVSTVSATLAVSSYTTTSTVSVVSSAVATVTNVFPITSTVTYPYVSEAATVSAFIVTGSTGFFDSIGYSFVLVILFGLSAWALIATIATVILYAKHSPTETRPPVRIVQQPSVYMLPPGAPLPPPVPPGMMPLWDAAAGIWRIVPRR